MFFFIFFSRFNITRSVQQKYLLTGNLKSFKKMSLHPDDIQTRRRKKKFSMISYFSLFFLTDLILPDRSNENIYWQVI